MHVSISFLFSVFAFFIVYFAFSYILVYKIRWHGKDRVKFVEKMVVGDIQGLDTNHGCLSLITNDQGGIKDDTVIVNAGMFH